MATDQLSDKEIFNVARRLDSPVAVDAYLDQVCGEDAGRRERVLELVAADKGDSFLEKPAVSLPDTVESRVPVEQEGQVIGNYKLLQKIGEGGFGVVYMAEQTSPVRRQVALKIIKPGMDTKEVIARFEAERQALAMMDHPNIAKVFDGGQTDLGHPFFVMELVKGVPLTRFCDENRLDTRERLRLFESICNAIQHAHQKGIIHRDVKPSNVLVTLHDGEPVPKVIDFGVAKAISQQLAARTLFTRYGQMVGTPQYMSPEQAEMSGLDIDTRTDIYSLGVLLYEVITGTTPIDPSCLRNTGYAEMQRMIREHEPPLPSRRLSSLDNKTARIASNRKSDIRTLGAMLRGELDSIVMKSLEKNREQRYETAKELAADIERYLNDEPVRARPQTTWYLLRKVLKRHRKPVFVAGSFLSLLLAAVVVSSAGWVRAIRERQVAVSLQQRAEEEGRRAVHQAYISDMNAAGHALELNDARLVTQILDRWGPGNDEVADLRTWEWYHLWYRLSTEMNRRSYETPVLPSMLSVSADGTRVAISGPRAPAVSVVDLRTGQTFGPFCSIERNWRIPVALSSDGTLLAYPHDDLRRVIVRNLEDEEIHEFPCEGQMRSAVFIDPDSLIIGDDRGSIVVWSITDSQSRAKQSEHTGHITTLTVSMDGQLLASASADGTVIVWDLSTLEILQRLQGHKRSVIDVDISPDKKWIASASRDGTVRLWNATTGQLINTLDGKTDEARQVSFSPAGDRLAIAGRDGTITVLGYPGLEKESVSLGYNSCFAMDFLQNGAVMYGAQDSKLVVWDPESPRAVEVLSTDFSEGERWQKDIQDADPYEDRVVDVGYSSQGDILIACHASGIIERWSLKGIRPTSLSPIHVSHRCSTLSVSSLDNLAVGHPDEPFLTRFDVRTGERIGTFSTESSTVGIQASAFSQDGRRFGAVFADGRAVVWRTNDRKVVFDKVILDSASLPSMCFLSDNTTMVAADLSSGVSVWDLRTGKLIDGRDGDRFTPVCVSASANEKRLAAAMYFDRRQIFVWDQPQTLEVASDSLVGHRIFAAGLHFIDDGKSLVSAGADCTIRIWDLATGRSRIAIEAYPHIFTCLAVSPDGTAIAAGSRDGTVVQLQRATEQQVLAASKLQ